MNRKTYWTLPLIGTTIFLAGAANNNLHLAAFGTGIALGWMASITILNQQGHIKWEKVKK